MGIYVNADGSMSVTSTPGFSGPGASAATGSGFSNGQANNPNEINNNYQQPVASWNLSYWTTTGSGSWAQKPILTINGQNFQYDTPQEYINKMDAAGINDGQSGLFRQQFQNAAPEFAHVQSSNPGTNVDGLYQKYFGRAATQEERAYWSTQNTSSLEQQLQTDYRNASGINYDGSPIQPGSNKTANQLGQQQQAVSSDSAINNEYQKYFGRNATSAEINNWKTQQISSLSSYLGQQYKQASGIDYDGSPIMPGKSQTNNQVSGATQDTSINAEYRKYFGRDATAAEIANWKTQPISSLSNYLNQQYKQATGIDYDGSPVMPGANKSNNQLGVQADDFDSLLNQMIQLDPFLAEQLKDPAKKAMFDRLDPALQSTYLQLLKTVGQSIEAGKVVNPNIEIEPSKVQEFLDQAKLEIDPYYSEVISNYSQDLKISLDRMKEDYQKTIVRAEDTFKQNLGVQAENEAQAGLTYGSERGVRLNRSITDANNVLGDAATGLARANQDAAIAAERKIGSSAFNNLGLSYGATEYGASQNGFAAKGTRSLFNPAGNLMGELPKMRTSDEIIRQNELIAAERAKRIMDASKLNGNPIGTTPTTPPATTTPPTTTPNPVNPISQTVLPNQNIKLPNGQVISAQDPNYQEYKRTYNL